jgi:ABC-type branched-subunit amino acid transport system substrate-binding protein
MNSSFVAQVNPKASAHLLCTIAFVLAIAGLPGCASKGGPGAARPSTSPPVSLRTEEHGFVRLPGMAPNHTPVRVALLLPMAEGAAETRAVANSIERAAELALFDSGNSDIVLMPRDDGGAPETAAAAAERAIADGAEIILGPLFAQSVSSVALAARAHGVPVIGFSSDRTVGGNGVYLLSFQPEDEVAQIIAYAARHGHTAFAALVPQNAYGKVVESAFRAAVASAGATVTDVESFVQRPEEVGPPVQTVAASHPDAILIAQGGVVLRSIAPTLALAGASNRTVKFLGTGLWDDSSIMREPMLQGGWFAAPSLEGERAFDNKYQSAYGAAPPRIASLGYDAMSLVALLAKGPPYQRYTQAALTDPNGFAGVDGIFRFHEDGSAQRGLAILEVQPTGFLVIAPAPTTFQAVGF